MARRARPSKDWRPALPKIKKPRKSRALFKPFQRAARKAFRHAVSILKRKKIVPKTIDARKVVPTSGLRKVIRKNKAILEGKETAYTLPSDFPKQAAKDLKKLGYRIVKASDGSKKLVVPKGQYVRKGQIFARPTTSRRGARVKLIPLGTDMETQIRQAFEGLKQGDFVAFQVNGFNSYNIYASPQSMIDDLSKYLTHGNWITNLAVFKVTGKASSKYLQKSSARRQETMRRKLSPAAKARRNLRARERRAFLQGVRVSRGH